MTNDQHRGAVLPGPFTSSPDRRIGELSEFFDTMAAGQSVPPLGGVRDPSRASQAAKHSLGADGHITRGMVVHAIPFVNWYKVQVGSAGGFMAACMGSMSGLMPLGPRDISMARPNDNVLLFCPTGCNYAIIICVLPPIVQDGRVLCPDWIVQGSGSGVKREEAHKFPFKHLYKSGGIIDWSANRPMDETAFVRGWISSTGIAVSLTNYMLQMRVNEQCGLFLNLFDSHARLAGVQLDIESMVHGEYAYDDEGEARYYRTLSTYPWEALGLYSPGTKFVEEVDDKEVQYTKHRAKVDLPESEADLESVYRYIEYGGYLGQGHLRAVVKPARDSGKRRYQDASANEADEGLFREAIGLDGSYSLISAKGLHIGKRCKIVVPRVKKLPGDKNGDDAEAGNYKFSGEFGGGEPHRVGDVSVNSDAKGLLRVAGVLDLIAHTVNWKAVHPFHYHKQDFATPQEAEQSTNFDKVSDKLDYSELSSRAYMSDPSPKKLKIDHRYGDVEYFQRESFIVWHDDGSLHLGCGFGAEIVMTGGRIRLTAPGGIDLLPGTDLLILADQIIGRAKRSIDLSASERDIRLKAERNMQLLAGNEKEGGLLLECLGEGTTQQYKQKYGEDVKGSGIILKAAKSTVATMAKDIYLRTGGEELGEGDILLDASRGKRRVQVFGREFNTYTKSGVSFHFGPLEDDSEVTQTYYFDEKTAVFDVKLLLKDQLINYGEKANIITKGGVKAIKSIVTAGSLADNKGGMVGKVADGLASIIEAACSTASEAASTLNEFGKTRHESTIVQKYYQEQQLGNDDNIKLIRFSFRDPPTGGGQYKVDGLKWPESRWQMMARLGGASGGEPWKERAVMYQGSETFPYPGKKKLKEEPIFLALDEFTMYDAANGYSKDRPQPYESARLGIMEPKTLNDEYKLNR